MICAFADYLQLWNYSFNLVQRGCQGEPGVNNAWQKVYFLRIFSFFVSGCDFCCFSLKKRDWRMLERTCFNLCACACLWALFCVRVPVVVFPIKFVIIGGLFRILWRSSARFTLGPNVSSREWKAEYWRLPQRETFDSMYEKVIAELPAAPHCNTGTKAKHHQEIFLYPQRRCTDCNRKLITAKQEHNEVWV